MLCLLYIDIFFSFLRVLNRLLSLFFLSWRSFWFNWAPHSMSVCVKYMCLNVCAMCKWCVLLVKHYITLSLKVQLLYKLYMILSFKHHSDSIMRRKNTFLAVFNKFFIDCIWVLFMDKFVLDMCAVLFYFLLLLILMTFLYLFVNYHHETILT